MGKSNRVLLSLALFLAFVGTLCPAWAESTPQTPIQQALLSQIYKLPEPNKTIINFLYQGSGQLYWTKGGQPTALAKKFVRQLELSPQDGIPSQRYRTEDLAARITRLHKQSPIDSIAKLEIDLSRALVQYAQDLEFGIYDYFRQRHREPRFAGREDFFGRIRTSLVTGRIIEFLNKLSRQESDYSILKREIKQWSAKELDESWTPITTGRKLETGVTDQRVTTLRNRLYELGYRTTPSPETTMVFDEGLAKALTRYQQDHQLDADGVLGPATIRSLNVTPKKRLCQLRVNMDRLRAKPEISAPLYVEVNIPEYQLRLFKHDRVLLTSKVIVGRVDRKTPLLQDKIRYIDFNPKWHLPKTIVFKDKLQHIRDDPGYLARSGMRLYEVKGKEKSRVDPFTVDWNQVDQEHFDYAIVQDSGLNNALGRIKFMFPNFHEVYLHDTPGQSLFNKATRTFSSGCIRIEKPLELAQHLLKDYPEWDVDKIDAVLKTTHLQTAYLAEKVPIYLIYETYNRQDNQLVLLDDVYSHDSERGKTLCTDL